MVNLRSGFFVFVFDKFRIFLFVCFYFFEEERGFPGHSLEALGLYLFKSLFCLAYFRGSLFLVGLMIRRNFALQNGLDLTIKTA